MHEHSNNEKANCGKCHWCDLLHIGLWTHDFNFHHKSWSPRICSYSGSAFTCWRFWVRGRINENHGNFLWSIRLYQYEYNNIVLYYFVIFFSPFTVTVKCRLTGEPTPSSTWQVNIPAWLLCMFGIVSVLPYETSVIIHLIKFYQILWNVIKFTSGVNQI